MSLDDLRPSARLQVAESDSEAEIGTCTATQTDRQREEGEDGGTKREDVGERGEVNHDMPFNRGNTVVGTG